MKKLVLTLLLLNAVVFAAVDSNQDEEKEIKERRKDTVALVEKAVKFFDANELEESFNAFTRSRDFINGELYIFAFDMQGFCFAHGQDKSLIWNNMWDTQDNFGTFIVQEMVKKAQGGGGWITYEWRGASKVSYIKPVKKDDQTFLVGAGYFPHSKTDAVVNLVRGAVTAFNKVLELNQPLDRAFGQMSYPLGKFVKGDLYLFAVRFDGLLVAQGERPSFIGSYALDYKDQKGVRFNQLIIDKLKENPTGGVWVEYTSKNAPKRTYAEKVTDKKGNNYFIACGYYPTADRQRTIDLVRKGYKLMKTSGLSVASEDFTDERNDDYRYGDLYLVVRNIKGVVQAHGKNPELIGTDEWNKRDQDGRYFVQEIIKKAEEGGGWVTYKVRNSFKSTYCEPVQLGLGKYVISSGLYPISKEETMILLSKSAAGYLQDNPLPNAIEQFVSQNGKFISGDIRIFVCDTDGIFLCDGNRTEVIWKNLINAKDDNGKPYVRLFINTAKDGAAKVTYTIFGSQRVSYVQEVSNGARTYIVGSGFYL